MTHHRYFIKNGPYAVNSAEVGLLYITDLLRSGSARETFETSDGRTIYHYYIRANDDNSL